MTINAFRDLTVPVTPAEAANTLTFTAEEPSDFDGDTHNPYASARRTRRSPTG